MVFFERVIFSWLFESIDYFLQNKHIANNFSCIKKRIEYILKEQKIKESNNVKNKNSQSKEQKKKKE